MENNAGNLSGSNNHREILIRLVLIVVPILIVYSIYYPGLFGPFLFDDIPNLSQMGSFPAMEPWQRMLLFLNSGDAGPTGRPISLISFFINDNTWPSDPFSFKYTNLMIHLLNGLLVLWFVFKLFEAKYGRGLALRIASISSFLWMIHPMQVSTVLYVIQRMTELSTMFVLGGLVTYLYSREVALEKPVRGLAYMTLGLVVFGLLAIFSKENGVLLLLYVLVVEYFFLQPIYKTRPKWFREWSVPVLWIPMGILAVYMFYSGVVLNSFSIREFTVVERILTESRVVLQYIKGIILPELGGSGLFHDDVVISRNLTDPVTTFPSIIAILALIYVAFRLRMKVPLIGFAIAWFFAGHVLESTIMPLELYFEHRNYLPLLGFVIAGAAWIASYTGRWSIPVKIVGGVLVLVVSLITASNARTWGDTTYAGVIWASEHPDSIRAQEVARESLLLKGRPDLASKYVANITDRHPADAVAILQRIQYDCVFSKYDENGEYARKSIGRLRTAVYAPGALSAVKKIGLMVLSNKCDVLSVSSYIELLDALRYNKEFSSSKAKHFIYYYYGLSYAELGNLQKAIDYLDMAYEQYPAADIRMQQALYLANAGLNDEAIRKLDVLENEIRPRRIVKEVKIRKGELDMLRKAIQEPPGNHIRENEKNSAAGTS